jgi:hypothetical protein
VLSFKGLAINLGYGFAGLLFALLLKAFDDKGHPNHAIMEGFRVLPLWLVLTFALFLLCFRKHRGVTGRRY